MKKLFLFAALFAAGFAVTSCSSDKDDVVETNGILGKFNANGEAFMALKLNLPTTNASGTRADDGLANGQFDDGTTAEYTVNAANSIFIILSGASESAATVKSSYVLGTSSTWSKDPNEQITTKTVTQAIKKKGISSGENIYALVILNHQGLIKIKAGEGETELQLADNTSLDGKTLAELQTLLPITTANLNGTNFIMTNAPLSDRTGASSGDAAVISTLSLINPDKIYKTEAEAAVSPAATVYVERVAAKVTVSAGSSMTGTMTEASVSYDPEFQWILDNQMSQGNLTRSFTAAWVDYQAKPVVLTGEPPVEAWGAATGYRFVETTPIETGSGYRTYWATNNAGATLGGAAATFSSGIAAGNSTYCNENATTVADMEEDKSTRIIVRVKISGGDAGTGTFYTIPTEGTDVIYTTATAETYVRNILRNESDVITWFNTHFASGVSLADILAKVSITFGANASDATKIDNVTAGDLTAALIKEVASTTDQYKGTGTVDDLATAAATAFNSLTSKENLKDNILLTKYDSGYAYYPIFIKHFGDYYTPWYEMEGTTTGIVYPAKTLGGETLTADQRYLGRWGVVRNNWYLIEINGIKHIGSAKIPPLTTTPLDQIKSYLSLKIAILPWAKRIQSVTL